MKKYESYKPLSELWLSSIPIHWNSRKIKYLFSERSEKGYPDEPLLVASQSMGVVPKGVYGNRTVEAMKDLHLLKLVRIGDFVISLRSFQGGMEYAYYQGIISPAYTIIIPKDMITPEYFKYLAKSRLFIELLQLCVTGIREGQNIDYNKLKNHQIPVPPRSEQDQIVRYLDWKVSEINKLIAAKKRQILLLREVEQKIIEKIVLNGIGKCDILNRKKTDWIREIPSDWNIMRIKFLFNLRDERSYLPLDEVNLISLYAKLGVIQNSDVEYKCGNKARNADGYKKVYENDIVVNIILCWMGAIGRSAYNGVTSPAYDVYCPREKVSSRYYHYLFRLPLFSHECYKVGKGIMAMRWRVYSNQFRNISVPVPPFEEQEKIAAYLDESLVQTESAISQLERQIQCLHELRTSLVSDVVTGQADVRNIEIPEFEYVEEIADEEDSEDTTDAVCETEEE